MDCMRSFSLSTTDQNTYTVASGAMAVWGAINNFSIYGTDSSFFNIQGFKNINVFGVDMIGNVSTAYGIAPRVDNANASDFEITVQLNGQLPQPVGVIGTPNDWPIINNNPFIESQYVLSKYNASVRFETPIQSVKSIALYDFKAFGEHAQNPLQIKMGYFIQLIIYYKFEGE